MRLPFLRSKPAAADAAPTRPDDRGPVEVARTRARQRLVGALVLLGAGVVSFPLVFDTQPRPLSPEIPMAASRDGATTPARIASRPLAPLPVLPADAGTEVPAVAAPAAASAPALVAAAPAATVPAPAPVPPAPAAVPPPAPTPTASQAPTASPKPAPVQVQAASPPPSMQGSVSLPAPTAAAPKAAVASSSPAAGRFVVQVGAYAEERALRAARQKAETLGLKTYIQVIDAEGAKRTRVRVGPFDTREQAEATAKKLKSGGLPAAILAL